MIPDALKQAREVIKTEKLAAFSFDIFDTFILRRTISPDGVYERAFHHAPIPDTHKHMVESFVQNRMIAESRARQIRTRKEQKEEVYITDIYDNFPTHIFGLPASARAQLVEAEFQAELDLCIVNPEIHDIYKEAQKLGLKMGFLSDTYWPKDMLAKLLKHVAPDLTFDFLYPSCEFGTGKSAKLFNRYLRNEEILPKYAAHMGDNVVADINVPAGLGIQTVYYPQASAGLEAIFQREKSMTRLIQSGRASGDIRIDNCLNVIRRATTARLHSNTDLAELLGVGVLGPIMTAFHRFTEHRVKTLRSDPAKKVVVLFLARDGHLPLKIWETSDNGPGYYVEINRRLSMLCCADDVEIFQEFFRMLTVVNESGVREFLKTDVPSISSYFKKIPSGRTNGKTFAEALPRLLDKKQIEALAGSVRKRFFTYLNHVCPEFENATDVVLVDMGYSGTIQHSLRKAIDSEGFKNKNLHGIYVATVDSKFSQLRESDSVAGFIDGSMLSPSAQHSVLRNIGIFEQLCVAPVGSVKAHEGTGVVREEDWRPKEQLKLCTEMQDACIRFAKEYKKLSVELGVDPFADIELARLRATTILARLLLAPIGDEQRLLGSLKHDVNLGTEAMMEMIDIPEIETMLSAMTFQQACTIGEPPAWLAGSFMSIAPMSGYAYMTTGFGFNEGGIMNDMSIDQIPLTLVRDGNAMTVPGSCVLTAFGDVRINVPIMKKDSGAQLAFPLEGSLRHGVIRSVTLQHGDNVHEALHDRHVESIPIQSLRMLQTITEGPYYNVTGEDGYLVMDVPAIAKPILIVTLTVTILPQSHATDHEQDSEERKISA